jgi:roadblock/LC7 domain-containing protein
VSSTITAADTFLATHPASSWSSLTKAQQTQVNGWATTLDNYNNGLTGPGHCSQ